MPVFQGPYHGFLINHFSASSVDYDCTGFQSSYPFLANKPNRVCTKGYMHAQNIRLSKHFFHVFEVLAEVWCIGVFMPRMVKNPHRKSVDKDS